jgi:Fur family ferric uptake transcriptional regulator
MKENNIAGLIKRVGLRYTSGRAALLGVLMDAPFPLTQDEISSRLIGTGLNRVTIYRALASFCEAGLVHRIESGDRIWRFAYCGCGYRGHCHPHFICRSCGKVECLEDLGFPEIRGLKSGYYVEERELYLRGLCAGCSAR